MLVLCVVCSKEKRQKPGQSGQRITDKAQRQNQKKKNPTGGMDVFLTSRRVEAKGTKQQS